MKALSVFVIPMLQNELPMLEKRILLFEKNNRKILTTATESVLISPVNSVYYF